MRRVLPRPARFSPQEYKSFLKAYPHVEQVLDDPFVDEDGEQIALIRESDGDVFIYIGLLSESQQDALGTAALRAIRKRLQKPKKKRLPVILVIMGAILVIVAGIILSGGLETIKTWLQGEKIPQPQFTATPTLAPVVKTSPTPAPKPTARPTSTPAATVTPTPEPAQSSPTPTLEPVPTVAPATAPSIRAVTLRDIEGYIIPAINGTYKVRPAQTISIEVEFSDDSDNDTRVDYSVARGRVESTSRTKASYIAPDRSGERDLLIIKLVENETDRIFIQNTLKIQTK